MLDKTYKNYLDAIGINGELVFKRVGIPYKSIDNDEIVYLIGYSDANAFSRVLEAGQA